MANMYYCDNCKKYYSCEEGAEYYGTKCPDCNDYVYSLGITQNDWVQKSEEEKLIITNEAVIKNRRANLQIKNAVSESVMFSNIGGKIKGLAKFVCGAGIIASVLGGILIGVIGGEFIYPSSAAVFTAFFVAILGSIFSWLGSFLLYGFGELIDKATIIAQNTQK